MHPGPAQGQVLTLTDCCLPGLPTTARCSRNRSGLAPTTLGHQEAKAGHQEGWWGRRPVSQCLAHTAKVWQGTRKVCGARGAEVSQLLRFLEDSSLQKRP